MLTQPSLAVNGSPWLDTADGKALLSHHGQRQLGEGEVLTIAAFAGAMSALVSSPAELVMIQQQKSGSAVRRGLGAARDPALSAKISLLTPAPSALGRAPTTQLLATAQNIAQQFGTLTLYRGLMPTMMREALFTCGYLGLPPVIKRTLARDAAAAAAAAAAGDSPAGVAYPAAA